MASPRILALLVGALTVFSLVGQPAIQTALPDTPVIIQTASAAEYPCAAGFIQIEDQAWWQDRVGEPWPGRHVHQQMCWPTGPVSGTVTIPVRILLHAQPAGARLTRIRITDGGSGNKFSQTTGLGLPDEHGDQSLVVNVTFSVSGWSSGVHEMRLATYVRQPDPDGVDGPLVAPEQFVSSAHPLCVGTCTGGTTRNYHEARAWYTGFLYDNARTRTKLTTGIISQPFSYDTACTNPSGKPITGSSAWIDPDAHNGSMGTNLLPLYPGAIRRTATVSGLTPGLHKIVIKCDASGNFSGQDGTSSGLFVYTVLVP